MILPPPPATPERLDTQDTKSYDTASKCTASYGQADLALKQRNRTPNECLPDIESLKYKYWEDLQSYQKRQVRDYIASIQNYAPNAINPTPSLQERIDDIQAHTEHILRTMEDGYNNGYQTIIDSTTGTITTFETTVNKKGQTVPKTITEKAADGTETVTTFVGETFGLDLIFGDKPEVLNKSESDREWELEENLGFFAKTVKPGGDIYVIDKYRYMTAGFMKGGDDSNQVVIHPKFKGINFALINKDSQYEGATLAYISTPYGGYSYNDNGTVKRHDYEVPCYGSSAKLTTIFDTKRGNLRRFEVRERMPVLNRGRFIGDGSKNAAFDTKEEMLFYTYNLD